MTLQLSLYALPTWCFTMAQVPMKELPNTMGLVAYRNAILFWNKLDGSKRHRIPEPWIMPVREARVGQPFNE